MKERTYYVPEATRREFRGGEKVTNGIVTHRRRAVQMLGQVRAGIIVYGSDQVLNVALFAEHDGDSKQ